MNNNTNNAVIITGNGVISAVIEGKSYTIQPDHPEYNEILDAARKYDWQKFVDNIDITSKVSMYISNDLDIRDGVIFYHNTIIDNTLTKRIVNFMAKDLPFKPLLKFLENLLQNPSYRAINELYEFLDVGQLPITEDGHFLAYKNVKADYTDIHSGKFNNSVGSVCEMPRNLVDEDKDRTCSSGLHFCSIKYLPHFADSNGGHTMIVKINPKDVVAIPSDYNNTKGRCSRYEVVAEYTDNWREKLGRGENGFDSDLYSSDGGDYEDEEVCENCGTTLDNWDEHETLCNSCNKDDEPYTTSQEADDASYADAYGNQGNDDSISLDDVAVSYWDKNGNKVDPNANGAEGNDGCCGGQCGCDNHYGKKPDGSLFHNLRDKFGRFIKGDKNVG